MRRSIPFHIIRETSRPSTQRDDLWYVICKTPAFWGTLAHDIDFFRDRVRNGDASRLYRCWLRERLQTSSRTQARRFVDSGVLNPATLLPVPNASDILGLVTHDPCDYRHTLGQYPGKTLSAFALFR